MLARCGFTSYLRGPSSTRPRRLRSRDLRMQNLTTEIILGPDRSTIFDGHHDCTFEPDRRHHRDTGDSLCAVAERGLHGGLGAGQRQPAHHLLARHGTVGNAITIATSANTTNLTLTLSGTSQRRPASMTRRSGWQLVHRSGGHAPAEPRRPRLEPELLSSAERLWIRGDGVVQHGTWQRRSLSGCRHRATLPRSNPGPAHHAVATNELLPY